VMKWRTGLAILLSVNFAPTFAGAQSSSSAEEVENICMPTLRVWRGTTEDIRQIQQAPVPKSFKTGIGGGCGGPIRADFLVGWHLRYGSEETVHEALAFIEKRDGAFEAKARQLDRDISDALAKMNIEFKVEDEREDSRLDLSQPDRLRSFIEKNPSAGKLRVAKDKLNSDLLDRINLYLTAAEMFGSKRLAVRARKVLMLYEVIEKRLLPTRDGGSSEMDPFVSQALEYVQDSSSRSLTSMEVELRLAVLEAQLTPDAKSIDLARETLKRRHQSAYANAPKVAFSGGDDFCDLYEERHLNEWEREIAKACKDDYAFVDKAMAYGYADAMLGILTGSHQRAFGKWDWEDYVVLHQKGMVYKSGQHRYLTGDHERVINLKLALADQHFSKTKAKAKGDRRWTYEEAWRLLAELSPLVNPAENPVRFRQIAERAMAVDAEMQREQAGWEEQHAQLLAYYRLNLQSLDKLAIGQVP
jgi:hypothetical protein